MAKRLIELSNQEAFDFLMKPDQYCTTELPEYFDFAQVLEYCRENVNEMKVPRVPDGTTGVNLHILTNKDGKYGVRPITISNPFLYTYLAHAICDKGAWERIVECFNLYKVDSIRVCSLPIVPDDLKKEPFHKSTTILNWWSGMEQTPIELSLSYRYMFMSDISNCFGQIIPKSIDWALSRRGTDIETGDNHQLAEKIINTIEALRCGLNVGIPQGSTLYSLIAEIVLGYADLLLDRAIKEAGIDCEYQVLRYVDDYRIFCNDRDTLEQISYILQHILEGLNFRMNVSKTRISESIVADAMKPDKAFYIFNTPIVNKKGADFDGFQKHLYYIFEFGRRYPNSGQLKVLLSDFSKRLGRCLKPRKTKKIIAEIDLETGNVNECNKPLMVAPVIREKILPMIAVLTQIASDNVFSSHYALRIVSLLIDKVKDEGEKEMIIRKVYSKLRNTPNSAYIQLWLQTLTYATGIKEINDYDVALCNIVENQDVSLWNNSWLDQKLANELPIDSVCNKKKLKDAGQIITFRDHRAYTESISHDD